VRLGDIGERWGAVARSAHSGQSVVVLYDDGRIACDDTGVIIGWYYPWGRKKISYSAIRSVNRRPLRRVRGRWRLWGSGDLVHWYNLDGNRPDKTAELELDLGGRIRPVITPDDPDAVAAIIAEHHSD
jgi:hypothetical protein